MRRTTSPAYGVFPLTVVPGSYEVADSSEYFHGIGCHGRYRSWPSVTSKRLSEV